MILLSPVNARPRIIKANSLGDTLWTKPFQVDALKYGLIANDGGYVFGGRKDSSSYLLKTNTNGDSLWSRVFLEDTSIKEVKTLSNILTKSGMKAGICFHWS